MRTSYTQAKIWWSRAFFSTAEMSKAPFIYALEKADRFILEVQLTQRFHIRV